MEVAKGLWKLQKINGKGILKKKYVCGQTNQDCNGFI